LISQISASLCRKRVHDFLLFSVAAEFEIVHIVSQNSHSGPSSKSYRQFFTTSQRWQDGHTLRKSFGSLRRSDAPRTRAQLSYYATLIVIEWQAKLQCSSEEFGCGDSFVARLIRGSEGTFIGGPVCGDSGGRSVDSTGNCDSQRTGISIGS
jgi:hypothetical protein